MTDDFAQDFERIIEDALNTFTERNKVYGDNFWTFGDVMNLIFPDGLLLKGADDFARFGLFANQVAKITRYAQNFQNGGHADSVHDCGVYSFMLETMDEQMQKEKEQ